MLVITKAFSRDKYCVELRLVSVTMKSTRLFSTVLSTLSWLLVAQFSAHPVSALCNLSATLECCELVMPATDPVAELVLSLAGISALPITTIGIACTPFTSASPNWYVVLSPQEPLVPIH